MSGAAARLRALALVTAVCAWVLPAAAQAPTGSTIDPARDVGLDQKMGAQAPLELPFRDEKGKAVTLGSYFGEKPVVLALVWYKCPGICGMELQSLAQGLKAVNLEMGRDFNVVTVSINPRETPELAADRKAQYAGLYGRGGAEYGWHFLVGNDPDIHRLAAAVGFRYAYDAKSDQYAHPAGVMVLTPQGRVSRYLFGLDYPPKDLQFALSDASGGHTGSLAQRVVILTCFHYDPVTGRYTVAIEKILKLAGVVTVLIIVGFLLLLRRFERRRAQEEAAAASGAQPARG